MTLLGFGNDLLSFSVSSNLKRAQCLIVLAPLAQPQREGARSGFCPDGISYSN